MNVDKIAQAIYGLVSDLPVNATQVSDVFQLVSAEKAFLEINGKSIRLCGVDIAHRIAAQKDKPDKPILRDKWLDFLEEMGTSYVRLNHLGVSYACADLDCEILRYKDLTSAWGLSLYEEPSEASNERWLFIGNVLKWQAPMFEIVLTKSLINLEDSWRPHFQIDIDTGLDEVAIDKLLAKYFGPKFVRWRMIIPNYGTVLVMGVLGSIRGTKICLGVGTSLRNPKYLRQSVLNKL